MGLYRLSKGGSRISAVLPGYGACGMLMVIGNGEGAGAEAQNSFLTRLHTGDPGAEGLLNNAAETAQKNCELMKQAEVTPGTVEAGRLNTLAVEWPEVKAKETYKWISLWCVTPGPTPDIFIIAIELTTPVEVLIGDTFRININKLAIALKLF